MKNEMFTAERVAQRLKLHPRTIRRLIREKKLHARKVGGQWRISEQDIRAFVGDREETDPSPSSGIKEELTPREKTRDSKIYVSSVVDIFVENAEEALRLSNSIFAVMNTREPMYGEARCDYVFYKDEMKARFILWGKPLFISQLLGLLAEISE